MTAVVGGLCLISKDIVLLTRLVDSAQCREVTDNYPQYFTFDVENWFSCDDNYAVISEDNIGFAEYKKPGVYWVHFCFNSARGREAINLTRDMLLKLVKERPVSVVVGLIEVNNRKARWLIRKVGLRSLGEITTENGLCEMFYSSSEEISNGYV